MRVWGLTDGSAGMEAQARALAEGLHAVDCTMKTARLRKPWDIFPNGFFALAGKYAAPLWGGGMLSPPFPDLVISCGRKGAAAALTLRGCAPKVSFVHIGDPYVNAAHYDAVVAMKHDKITGPNVIKTRFALHGMTPQKLTEAREKWQKEFAPYPAPRVAVLLGGSTHRYTLTRGAMKKLIADIRRIKGSLLITPSRRTGKENLRLLQTALRRSDAYIHSLSGENPYLGLLAWADYIIVTNDSVNMMSEAVATAKPVYILPLPGYGAGKPARFAERLIDEGIARRFSPQPEHWSHAPVLEMPAIAQAIKNILKNQAIA